MKKIRLGRQASTVFANDLWISATENLKRFEEAGVADLVFPIQAEAHALPYAEGFFDALGGLGRRKYASPFKRVWD